MTATIDRPYEPSSELAAPGRSLSVMANSTMLGSDEAKSAGSIAANDFLTLLIAEMKNQDPTANTDPNQYVNQLVQVNSLQQLISINETLQDALAPAPRSDTGSRTAHVNASWSPGHAASSRDPTRAGAVSGNLSVPANKSVSSRLATALTDK